MIITQAITAGTWFEYYEQGDFFRILTDSASTTFDVEFYNAGKEVVEAVSVKAGYSERFIGGGFDRIKIRATANATVQFVIRLGNVVGYDIAPTGQVSGTVAIDGVTNAVQMVHITPVVTSASTLLRNAKSNRRYLLLQNKDSVGNIWVRVEGVSVSQATGIFLGPGDSLEFASICPSGAIFAIGDIASNPNLLVVEG